MGKVPCHLQPVIVCIRHTDPQNVKPVLPVFKDPHRSSSGSTAKVSPPLPIAGRILNAGSFCVTQHPPGCEGQGGVSSEGAGGAANQHPQRNYGRTIHLSSFPFNNYDNDTFSQPFVQFG